MSVLSLKMSQIDFKKPIMISYFRTERACFCSTLIYLRNLEIGRQMILSRNFMAQVSYAPHLLMSLK